MSRDSDPCSALDLQGNQFSGDRVPDSADCPFALYYDDDAYTTRRKIMGRQAAGQELLSGVARTWSRGVVRAVGARRPLASAMLAQLKIGGFAGKLKWSDVPDWQAAREAGTLYFPAPPAAAVAAARNIDHPEAFSVMGVTHSLSSRAVIDQIGDLLLPPFQPWDALICTSVAARTFVSRLHDDMRAFWHESTGATRFVDVQLPVIPLGVNAAAFAVRPGDRDAARQALALRPDEIAFLFAGRLSFHAKANPLPAYQALETIARERPVACIEAGIFPNEPIRQAYLAAQSALAPSVRFIWIDGLNEARYRQTWLGADVFVSLADNIQETFGLAPLEAMAAGLPVVVSDWDGYKDTVREGIDGLRIPTVLPPAGAGDDIAQRHALSLDSYDVHIGRSSLATVVEPRSLEAALRRLASDAGLRQAMGAAGQARARNDFDWPVILRRYGEVAGHLADIRRGAQQGQAAPSGRSWPRRLDPFHRFAHFPTRTLAPGWAVQARPDALAHLSMLLSLAAANYDATPQHLYEALLSVLKAGTPHTVESLLAAAGLATPAGMRGLMWLWKFDLVEVRAAE